MFKETVLLTNAYVWLLQKLSIVGSGTVHPELCDTMNWDVEVTLVLPFIPYAVM